LAGKRVLIHGATGAVGQACAQLALAGGMEVVGTVGSEMGEGCLQQLGVNSLYNHRENGQSNYFNFILHFLLYRINTNT